MDLRQFYERVESLIVRLNETGHAVEASKIDVALRGGATSGEILDRLGVALPVVAEAVPELSTETEELETFVKEALRRRL